MKINSTLDLEVVRTILCGVDSLVTLFVTQEHILHCEAPSIEDVVGVLAGESL